MAHSDIDEEEYLEAPERQRMKHGKEGCNHAREVLAPWRWHVNEPNSLVFGNAHLNRERAATTVHHHVMAHFSETRRDLAKAGLESGEMKFWHRHAVQSQHSD